MAYNDHVRLAIPGNDSIVDKLARAPKSAALPVGWKALVELGPHGITIATKCLSRCPHWQTKGVRLPMGIEGAVVCRPALLTDPELR